MGYDKRRAVARMELERLEESASLEVSPAPLPPKKRRRKRPKPPNFDWRTYCANKNRRGRRKRYAEYRRSSAWRRVRVDAIARAGGKCELCDKTNTLQVHHTTYERLGAERPEDLRVLCQRCHNNVHYNGVKAPPANKETRRLARVAFEARLAQTAPPKKTKRRPMPKLTSRS